MIEEHDYVDVRRRVGELDLQDPTLFCFLPRNFGAASSVDNLLHESSVKTVRVLFRQAGLRETPLESDHLRVPTLQQNAFELIIPVLFLSECFCHTDPNAVSTALGVLRAYAVEFFKEIIDRKVVVSSVVIEESKSKKYREFRFRGSPEHYPKFLDTVRDVCDGR